MQEGKKNDFLDKKLRWDLLPLDCVEKIVKVYTAGAEKYGDNNWQHLNNGYQRYKAALLRHLVEYEKGNKIDSDTGCEHLAQVAWNAIALLWISNNITEKSEEVKDNSIKTEENLQQILNKVPKLNPKGLTWDSSARIWKKDPTEVINKLDERILEKIETCNRILDELDLNKKQQLNKKY